MLKKINIAQNVTTIQPSVKYPPLLQQVHHSEAPPALQAALVEEGLPEDKFKPPGAA